MPRGRLDPVLDRKRKELQAELAVVRSSEPSAIATLGPRLADLLGASAACAYRHEERDGHLYTPEGSERGLPGMVDTINAVLADAPPVGWTGYNALRPAPIDRNRVTLSEELHLRQGGLSPLGRVVFTKAGLQNDEIVRVVVCEGASMLGFVACFQKAPFEARQLDAVRRLVPHLRRRFALDRLWISAPRSRAVMLAALEAIAAPAWVVLPTGAIEHANAAGRAAIEHDRAGTLARLRLAARGVTIAGQRATPVRGGGEPDATLVVEQRSASDSRASAMLRARAAKMGLSPRVAEVYALVARGLSNQTIAAELAIAERTVEQYVSTLLERAGVESRAALVAQLLWAEE